MRVRRPHYHTSSQLNHGIYIMTSRLCMHYDKFTQVRLPIPLRSNKSSDMWYSFGNEINNVLNTRLKTIRQRQLSRKAVGACSRSSLPTSLTARTVHAQRRTIDVVAQMCADDMHELKHTSSGVLTIDMQQFVACQSYQILWQKLTVGNMAH
jgi:hypothetical protein